MKIPLAMLMVMALATASWAQQTSPGARPSASRTASGDHTFAMKAGQANLAEIELGKLALQKSTTDDVKKFAQEMIEAHTASSAKLKAAATKAGLSGAIPTFLGINNSTSLSKLQALSGEAFDREYLKNQVSVHEDALKAQEAYAKNGDVPELRALAKSATSMVRNHLDEASKLAKTIKQ